MQDSTKKQQIFILCLFTEKCLFMFAYFLEILFAYKRTKQEKEKKSKTENTMVSLL